MKIYPTTTNPPRVRRDLADARSSRGPSQPSPRQTLLNDRRSTR